MYCEIVAPLSRFAMTWTNHQKKFKQPLIYSSFRVFAARRPGIQLLTFNVLLDCGVLPCTPPFGPTCGRPNSFLTNLSRLGNCSMHYSRLGHPCFALPPPVPTGFLPSRDTRTSLCFVPAVVLRSTSDIPVGCSCSKPK